MICSLLSYLAGRAHLVNLGAFASFKVQYSCAHVKSGLIWYSDGDERPGAHRSVVGLLYAGGASRSGVGGRKWQADRRHWRGECVCAYAQAGLTTSA